MAPGDIAFKRCVSSGLSYRLPLLARHALVPSSNFATMKDGICISRRADRNFESLGPVRALLHATRRFHCILIKLRQILCAALNGAQLPSFPAHSVAVK